MGQDIGDVSPETVNGFRDEERRRLKDYDPRELALEAAVNSRIAVRLYYNNMLPRIKRLENRYQVALGVLVVLNPLLAIMAGFVGFTVGGG